MIKRATKERKNGKKDRERAEECVKQKNDG